jgi:hypothetical protein
VRLPGIFTSVTMRSTLLSAIRRASASSPSSASSTRNPSDSSADTVTWRTSSSSSTTRRVSPLPRIAGAAAGRSTVSARSAQCARGRKTRTVVPSPGALSISMRPPDCCAKP